MAIDCGYNEVAGLNPAMPQKVADCLASMRSDLVTIIPKWEQSGQGEGGRDNDESNDDVGKDLSNDNNEDVVLSLRKYI